MNKVCQVLRRNFFVVRTFHGGTFRGPWCQVLLLNLAFFLPHPSLTRVGGGMREKKCGVQTGVWGDLALGRDESCTGGQVTACHGWLVHASIRVQKFSGTHYAGYAQSDPRMPWTKADPSKRRSFLRTTQRYYGRFDPWLTCPSPNRGGTDDGRESSSSSSTAFGKT